MSDKWSKVQFQPSPFIAIRVLVDISRCPRFVWWRWWRKSRRPRGKGDRSGAREGGGCVDELVEVCDNTGFGVVAASAGGEGGRDGMEHGSHSISKFLESEWTSKTGRGMRNIAAGMRKTEHMQRDVGC